MENQPTQASPSTQTQLNESEMDCVEIILTLAEVYRFNLTDRALKGYIYTVGHRSDEDLLKSMKNLLRYNKFMPTPAELLEGCGPIRESRQS